MPAPDKTVPVHNTDEPRAEEDNDTSTNIVNVHDPFFLWGLFEHSDRALIRALGTLSDADCSLLYWSCHYHKHSKVCQYVLDNCAPVRIARDAIEMLSEMTKAGDTKTPDLTQIPVPFLLPTSPQFLVTELRDGSIIPSKGKPLKFTVVDREGNTKICIYKHGDELLQDAICVAVMKEMNAIFKEENVPAEIVLYEVLPVARTEGLIECVENAHPFLEFKTTDEKRDVTSTDALKTFIEKEPERKGNLFRTFLGFIISGIVLQLADRHDDNIMITDDGKILHIDFGCAFGQKTKLERLLGIFMDIPHSPFSEDVFIAMIGHESDNEIITQLWQSIKEHIWSCFNALRLHKNRFKPLGEEKFEQLYESLMVGLSDQDAREALDIELDKCYNNRFNAARAFYYKIQQNMSLNLYLIIRQILIEEKDLAVAIMNLTNGSLLPSISSSNAQDFIWELNWNLIILVGLGLIFLILVISVGICYWCNRVHRLRRQHSLPLAINDFIETTKIQEKCLSSSPIRNQAPPVPPRPTAYTTVLGKVEYRSNL